MGLNLSSELFAFPDRTGLYPNSTRSTPNSRGIKELEDKPCRGRSIRISFKIGGLPLDRCPVQDVCCRSPFGEPAWERIMHFREEPVTPVYRHWMCEQVGCNGELLSTGESITRLSTSWKHRCGKCGHEDWADATYPRVAYLPIDAIGPDDSYT
jgi:hypothetical protein